MIDLVFEALDRRRARRLHRPTSGSRTRSSARGSSAPGAGPRDPGTASIKLMHYQGDLDGQGPVWGYVEGGMGMVSFAIADAAPEAGATLALRRPGRPRSSPARASTLEDGTRISADDRDLQRRPEAAARHARRRRGRRRLPRAARGWKIRSPVVKFNASLDAAADLDRGARRGLAGAGDDRRHRRPIDDAQRGVRALRRAASRRSASARSTSRPATTPRPAPEGKHLMSVFGQYAPYELADGDWDARRDEVGEAVHRPDRALRPRLRATASSDHEVLGPPDIEARIGLTGGNIFQGEVDARPDVGAPPRRAHAGPRPLPLRRRDPSRGQRDRPQRPQRRDGRARGRQSAHVGAA